ncbi:MAG: hypothetical protein HY812_04820 [Planctomycetes bacterium]|nr:hypothetical protein [Planctomycetota bacterium]
MKFLLLALALAQASDEPAQAPAVVFSSLGGAAHDAVAAAVRTLDPGVSLRFVAVHPAALVERLAQPGGVQPIAVIGYATSVLQEAAGLDLIEPAGVSLATAQAALSDSSFAGARSASDGPGAAAPAWLPETFEELCSAAFQGRVRLAAAWPWNATGALVASLTAGQRDADRLLAGLDANVEQPYAESGRALLSRLAASAPGAIGVATASEIRGAREGSESALGDATPRGPLVCVLLGVAAVKGGAAPARPLFQALDQPELVARIAVLERLVPAAETVPDRGLDGWMMRHRLAFAGSSARLAEEQSLTRSAVRHYRDEVAGSLARKEALFSEYFDAAGIALLVGFIVWILWRKERPAARRGPGEE